jgi:hypothetical protein
MKHDDTSDPPLFFRGRTARSYVEYLRSVGLFDAVRARVPVDTQRMMDHPPERAEWCRAPHLRRIIDEVGQLAGTRGLREMVHEGTVSGTFRIMLPFVRGLLRLFGTSPRTLLSRVEMLMRDVTRGYRYSFQERDRCSGVLEIRSPAPVTVMGAEAWAAACESVVNLSGTPCNASVEEIKNEEVGSVVRVLVVWR